MIRKSVIIKEYLDEYVNKTMNAKYLPIVVRQRIVVETKHGDSIICKKCDKFNNCFEEVI